MKGEGTRFGLIRTTMKNIWHSLLSTENELEYRWTHVLIVAAGFVDGTQFRFTTAFGYLRLPRQWAALRSATFVQLLNRGGSTRGYPLQFRLLPNSLFSFVEGETGRVVAHLEIGKITIHVSTFVLQRTTRACAPHLFHVSGAPLPK